MEMLIPACCFQYVTPVVKYDRNGFKARERLLVLTQSSAYVVEMAKIKQKIEYSTLKGTSGSHCPRLGGTRSSLDKWDRWNGMILKVPSNPNRSMMVL